LASKRKNFKGRSPNVLQYIESCGNEEDIGSLLSSNLAAGARLAAENESQARDEKTSRTYQLRLMLLELFAQQNGDDAVLFGTNKRPFLAATIQTYMRKSAFYLFERFRFRRAELSLNCFALKTAHLSCILCCGY